MDVLDRNYLTSLDQKGPVMIPNDIMTKSKTITLICIGDPFEKWRRLKAEKKIVDQHLILLDR